MRKSTRKQHAVIQRVGWLLTSFFVRGCGNWNQKGLIVWMRLQKNLFEISTSHLLELCRKYFVGKLGITFSAIKLWGNFKQKSSKINDPTCRCCWTPCRGIRRSSRWGGLRQREHSSGMACNRTMWQEQSFPGICRMFSMILCTEVSI